MKKQLLLALILFAFIFPSEVAEAKDTSKFFTTHILHLTVTEGSLLSIFFQKS